MFNLNHYLSDPDNIKLSHRTPAARLEEIRQVRPLHCADGLEFSAQASKYHYCTPRDSQGPWAAVEVGFPNREVPEFMEYAEEPERPTDTVYGYVPVEVVEAVVDAHGGLAAPQPESAAT